MIAWTLVRLLRRIRDRAEAVDHILAAALATPSRAAYLRYLCDVYGFVVAIEPALVASPWAADRCRERSDALAGELLALGLSTDDIASLREVAAASTPIAAQTECEALGWLVVVERAYLQAARFRAEIPLDQVSDLAPDRDAWIMLGRQVTETVQGDTHMAAITGAALTALDALEDWALVTAGAERQPVHATQSAAAPR